MFTLDELRSAWERVEENEGCAGVDRVTVERFAADLDARLEELRRKVVEDSYRPLPLLKIVVQKAPGSAKMRRLLVPCVADRVLQTAAARQLSRSFEDEFLDSSFAYRPGRSVDRAVARVIQWRDRDFFYVLDADIHSYFDEIDHSLLAEALAVQNLAPRLAYLLTGWIRAEIWDGARVTKLAKGIAQGSPLSPLLANFFLGDYDLELEKSGHHLVRYADDFLVLCRSPEAAAEALALTREWMRARKLRMNADKTRITSFATGFQFLGVFFLGENVYIPWKGERPQGKVLFVAPPMPARLLERYRLPPPRGTMEAALRRAAVAAAPKPVEVKGRRYVAYLYVTEQGAVLRKSGERFLVEKDDRVLLDLPYHKLETVLVFGSVQITTQAMAELLEKGITVSLFSRQGRFRGSLTPPHGKDVLLRVAQFDLYRDVAAALDMARWTIEAKIANGEEVLRRYGRRAGMLQQIASRLEAMESARAAVPAAASLEALSGVEGSAAREYFTGLMTFNRSEFSWPGRIKHPATDPVNALLSLAYTLLLHELSSLLEGLGMDPFLGYLHQPDYGRPSLALDLLEPFRHPVADRLVVTLINRRIFQKDDFLSQPGREGLFLTPEGLRQFLDYYERWMLARPPAPAAESGGPEGAKLPSFRQQLKKEAEGLVRRLRHNAEWRPFRWAAPEDEDPEEICNTLSATI